MAKYITGNQPWYHEGILTPPHTEVEIPDDMKPSRTWTKAGGTKPPEPVDNTPKTMHGAQQHGRPSNRKL